jgi:RNA polymerase sigma-70 factor, ECF subfamily
MINAAQPSEAKPHAGSGAESAAPAWSALVERIRAGEPSGMEELYRVFYKGIRFYLFRRVGPQDLDDRVHDVFLIITQSILRGELREPDRLMGYVRTVVRRQVAAHIDGAVQARHSRVDIDSGINLADHHPDPERGAIERQTLELALRVLNSIPKRDREVLTRFYLKEQQPGQICHEMALSETQFRLIKSRAKARFGQLGKSRFSLKIGFRRPKRDS